jgi:ribosomal protein S18 acetylase RimI-like enzyme
MDSTVRIEEVPAGSREGLKSIIDQSFHGIYLWHARRTLFSVTWVREATRGDTQTGLSMSKMLGQGAGYVYYIAVSPSWREKGIGGLLLDDAIQLLRVAGAREIFACVRADNTPSIRLLWSRNFVRTGFRELVLVNGLCRAARFWMRMVVAPGEKVFVRVNHP